LPTEIVAFAPELLPAVRRFAEKTWERPRTEVFYRWRYLDPPFLRGFLAMRDGECLAMEFAICRPWRVGDEEVDLLEVFDWYCLPELRNSGLGVRVMQRLMREKEPLMLLGGSEDTRALLPRLGWRDVALGRRFVLALGGDRVLAALESRFRLPRPAGRLALGMARPWLRPRRRRAPPDGRVVAVAGAGDEIADLYRGRAGYGTFPLWSDAQLRWLVAGFAGAGHFVPLYFARGETLVGFALLRVYPTGGGADGELVELFAPAPDASLYTWMISEVSLRAAGFGVGVLGANTTCPTIATALRHNRFLELGSYPMWLWSEGRRDLPGPILVGSNTGDTPFAPYAGRWWAGVGRGSS
jgi:hypothetical protein